MSDIAMAHHGHHHHAAAPAAKPGFKLPPLAMPHIHHLSDVLAVAGGSQGPGARNAVFLGAAVVLVLILLAVRKMRRTS